MSLKLMYITKNPVIAKIAENSGVDRIFVDMEYIGKNLRQGGMDTVQSHHTIADVQTIRKAVTKSELLVRCNPIHDASEEYDGSETEISAIIESGADYVMLPFFKTREEVAKFLQIVNGRAKTVLLFETPESVSCVHEILELKGIDEAFIGLNDLSLGYHKKFMFELLADGTVEKLSLLFRQKNIPFGFGGIAAVGKGMLPAEKIIREHYRLFSKSVILSRSFCNTQEITEVEEIKRTFKTGILQIREVENECAIHSAFFGKNIMEIQNAVDLITNSK